MGYDERDHQRAARLGATDATVLLASIPGLRLLLTKNQMQAIQKVLDAAVLNPVLVQEANTAYKDSVVAQSGSVVMRDPAKLRIVERKQQDMIHRSEQDRRIRLDFTKMLTADALVPRSNNPDEAEYLGKVRLLLEHHGVWLRLSQPFVRDPQDASRHAHNPAKWEVWLSLGYAGDAIPTGNFLIDREELLQTTMLGAGYYRAVLTGTVQTKISRTAQRPLA